MIIEAILFIVGFYLFAGLGMYVYSVVKSWELLGFWRFDINKTHVVLCRYPRWLLFWLEIIISKVRSMKTAIKKGE